MSTPDKPTDCSIDKCPSAAILALTIGYWGMEAWIYLCPEHVIAKRRAGEEVAA